jgi:hypothetical protein
MCYDKTLKMARHTDEKALHFLFYHTKGKDKLYQLSTHS